MACDRFTEAIRGSARGLTLPADAAAHLAVCGDCRATLDIEEQVMTTIDAALAEVVSTGPAPNFVSRVRERVEHAPRWAPSAWIMPPIVAALALLLAAVAVSRLPDQPSTVQQASVGRSVDFPLAAPKERPVNPVPSTAMREAKRHVGVRQHSVIPAVRAPQSPEVLLPDQQREAVDRLFASVRAGRPEVVSMLMNLQSGPSSISALGVVIEPLSIEPVVVPALALSASIDNK